MSVVSVGTTLSTSLSKSITFKPGYGSGMSAADIATVALAIKDDKNVAHPIFPGAFSANGILYVPNRGQLKVLPGDVVAVDPETGWPILISANAIANGPWAVST